MGDSSEFWIWQRWWKAFTCHLLFLVSQPIAVAMDLFSREAIVTTTLNLTGEGSLINFRLNSMSIYECYSVLVLLFVSKAKLFTSDYYVTMFKMPKALNCKVSQFLALMNIPSYSPWKVTLSNVPKYYLFTWQKQFRLFDKINKFASGNNY